MFFGVLISTSFAIVGVGALSGRFREVEGFRNDCYGVGHGLGLSGWLDTVLEPACRCAAVAASLLCIARQGFAGLVARFDIH